MVLAQSWLVLFCFFLIGVAPWLAVNAIFSQVPIWVAETPEKEKLSSQLMLIVQSANLTPVIFLYCQKKCKPTNNISSIDDWNRICKDHARWLFFIFISSMFVLVLAALSWRMTLNIANQERSVALLFCTLVAGSLGCLSSVVIWPFATLFVPNLTTAVSGGMGFAWLLSSVVSLLQKPGQENQAFSASTFFIVISFSILPSLLCLWFVTYTTFAAPFRKNISKQDCDDCTDNCNGMTESNEGESLLFANTKPESNDEIRLIWPQIVTSFVNFLVPGTSPVLVSYFDESQRILFLSSTIGSVCGILGRVLCVLFDKKGEKWTPIQILWLWAFFQTSTLVSLLILSHLNALGHVTFIPVLVLCLHPFFFGGVDTLIYRNASVLQPLELSQSTARLLGVYGQIGAFAGAIIAFGLVQLDIL